MKKTNTNLLVCAMVFAVALVISNVVTAKTVQTGVPLFGGTVVVPAAVVCYCVTFLMTDVIGEIWGAKEAHIVVLAGFVCQVVALCMILIAQALPAADPAMQSAFDLLLGQNAVFVVASMAGYLLSQSWDVFVFHKIRGRVLAREAAAAGGEGAVGDAGEFAGESVSGAQVGGRRSKKRWIWNNASTMTSQIIDTVVFIGIAFGLGFGWLFDPALRMQLLGMMVGQYACKFLLAALDTPFFYLMTRR